MGKIYVTDIGKKLQFHMVQMVTLQFVHFAQSPLKEHQDM